MAVGSCNSLTAAYLHLSEHAHKGEGGTCSGGPGDTYCRSTNVGYRLDTQAARDFLDDYVTEP